MVAGVVATRLHGQPADRCGRARRHEPRPGARGGRRRRLPRERADRRPRARRGQPRRRDPRGRRARTSSSRSGPVSKIPPLEGIADIPLWTNREATLARELPASLLVLGGGPTGCELAQVYARFEVPTTIVQSGPRLAPTDHPRNSEAIRAALLADGVTVRLGVRALRAHASAGPDGQHVVDLDDGSTAQGHVILVAVGREFPLGDLGLEHYGLDPAARLPFPRDGRLRIDDGLYVDRRPGWPGAPHPPGPLPGRARRADGAGRSGPAGLPRPAARDLHGSRRPPRSASPWARRSITATMRSSWSPTSRGPPRATRSRRASGT